MSFVLVSCPSIRVISLRKSAIGGRNDNLFGVWKHTERCVVVWRGHVWIVRRKGERFSKLGLDFAICRQRRRRSTPYDMCAGTFSMLLAPRGDEGQPNDVAW